MQLRYAHLKKNCSIWYKNKTFSEQLILTLTNDFYYAIWYKNATKVGQI